MTLPPTDPERQKDRVLTWRLGVVGTIAIIMAALIGGGASWISAKVQADSQAEQAHDESLRQQRKDAYTAIIADYNAMLPAMTNYIHSYLLASGRLACNAVPPYEGAEFSAYAATRQKFANDQSLLSVVGSDEAGMFADDAYGNIVNLVSEASNSVVKYGLKETTDSQCYSEIFKSESNHLNLAGAAEGQFVFQARKEFGAGS